jgi:hypothetical protein
MLNKFDVTFLRGPRDLTPWKKHGRQLAMLTASPQNDEDALRARVAYREKRDDEYDMRKFPNAIHQTIRSNK